MAESRVTLAGAVGQDPVQRRTQGGAEVIRFGLAVTERVRDPSGTWADGATSWFQVSAWGTLGKNAAASIRKGQRVLVHGVLTVREFEGKDGSRGREVAVRATSIGHDLTFGTAEFARATRAEAVQGAVGQAQAAERPAPRPDRSDEWAAPGADGALQAPDDLDDPPF